LALLLLSLFVCGLAQGTAAAETRIALIIANGAYSGQVLSRLDSPSKDAEILSGALTRAGFEVLPIVRDANLQTMRIALNDFARKLRRAGADAVGFFYYSGHGAALAERGENYLIPTGADIEETSELSFNALGLTDVVRLVDDAGAKASFVVIDACRDVPFKGRKGSGPKGFVVQNATKGMIIGFATRPGETADASNAYSSALASSIATPALDATNVFKDVQRKVANLTGGRQVPWIEDGLLTEFYFTAASASDPAGTLSQSTSATPTPAQKPPTTLASATINAEPDNNTAISDPGLLKEVRERLYELNFDPGPFEGPETEDTRKAIREFEQQSRLAQTGIATMGLLRKLREVRSVRPWAAIVYAPSQKKGGWGMSWGTETRKEAIASARSSCRSASCAEEVSFFGTQCGAFAYSGSVWSIVAKDNVQSAKEAALAGCRKRGSSCRIKAAVCADGSERIVAADQ
jgi:hypothetical protein